MRNTPLALTGFAAALVLAPGFVVAPTPALAARRASVTVEVAPAAALFPRVAPADTIEPPPEQLPFATTAHICPQNACAFPSRPICPEDSIQVLLKGVFPSNCYTVKRIDLYYPPFLRPRIGPPWVRVVVDDGACQGRPCIVGGFPWNGSATLPPLPEGSFGLVVAVIPVSCVDTIPDPPWKMGSFPFSVAASCDSVQPPVGCLLDHWQHPGGVCDATVSGAQPAKVTFTLSTNTDLAGLQGSLIVSPPGLRITNLEPAGPAAGMHLSWSQTGDGGARFVLIADNGAPISQTADPVPVLEVTASAVAGVPIPPTTYVRAYDLLGSNVDGRGVLPCPILTLLPPGTPVQDAARICDGADCDYNHDGLTDVRDLVLIVRCLHADPRPAAPPCHTIDCDVDGTFDIQDVLCCALRILRQPPCLIPEGCPPDTSNAQRDDSVRVSVGLPVEAPDGIRVPIHIEGAQRIGAARLAMRFPSDRYRVDGLDHAAPGWFPIADAEGSDVVMGLIRMNAPPGGTESLDLSLRLRPIEGQPGGGELGALRGDFSSPDGTTLLPQVDGPVRPLPGGPSIELSENRPDPFSGETRFTLTLPRATSVDLAVYDLNGRRVATLHHGPLAAGVSEFAWGGRLEGGGRARSGVYFYRAELDGHAASLKMVLLGGR